MPFRYLLQSWLQRTVERKVREAVVEAAKQQVEATLAQAESAACTDQPPRCDVGVVFALAVEAAGLEDLLENVVTTRGQGFVVRQGGRAGRRLAVVVSGPGRARAAKATECLIAGHQPQCIISAGFAGALHPKLRRSDILVADELLDVHGNRFALELDAPWRASAASGQVHVGRLLTADRIVRLPKEKQTLGRQFEALAVDMETVAVAEVCRRHHVRLLAVRAISDAIDDELPHDVEWLMTQKSGAARLGAAVGAIFNRPGSLKDLLQLKENALVASDRLGKFLLRLVEIGPRPGIE